MKEEPTNTWSVILIVAAAIAVIAFCVGVRETLKGAPKGTEILQNPKSGQ
jgi:hypothetical protein